jgi:hypothetical protein
MVQNRNSNNFQHFWHISCYGEKEMKLAETRDGTVHILDPNTTNKKDPWQRALCGDPGDFMALKDKCEFCGHDLKLPKVSCEGCLKALKRKGGGT